jgi:protein-S-isoprenylcysteine O-methyltransferase Ste14
MKEERGEHPFGDAGQLIFLFLFLMVWTGDSFLLKKATFPADLIPSSFRLVILGIALLTAACLAKSGHVVVCHERRPEHVVSNGAFGYVRHPLYLAAILSYLGLSLSTGSLFSMALLVFIFIFYNFIASYEEKLLEEKYGAEYRLYKNRTGKWIPKIRTRFRQSPASL